MIRHLPIAAAFGYFGLFSLVTLVLGFNWYRHMQPPEQPIAFSHEIHVGKVGLECRFCHLYADKSPHAGVPTVEKCMSCHSKVATERPEIQKLSGYWERQEPVEWNRVHSLRIGNYVHFTHDRHIKAGLDCAECHGDVRYMPKIRQVSSLSMGWCVECHRMKKAPTDCYTCHK